MLLLVVLFVAILVPFVGIAFHIDEPLFIWAAEHIRQQPANPYGFTVNWYGYDMPMSDVTKNPPLASYYIAAVAAVIGWSEVALHLAFILPAIAVVLGSYLIAARLCRHPVVAVLVGLLTPVFVVSSLTAMSDVIMLAFWLFAVHSWLKALETKRDGWFVLGALFIALAALSKYFGIMLIPMLLAYSIVRERRLRTWMLYLLIPVVVLAGYQLATARLYGRGLLSDAATYASGSTHALGGLTLSKTLAAIAFTGGCLASVLFFSRRLWSWRALVPAVGFVTLVTLVAQAWVNVGSFSMPAADGPHWLLSAQIGVWAAVGVSLVAIACVDLWRSRDADSLLLFMWAGGTFIFAAFVNWSTNGRSILPMVVPAGILVARRLEAVAVRHDAFTIRSLTIPLGASALLSLLVLRADYLFAETSRAGAALIRQKFASSGHTTWFEGHWGLQYYMQQLGAKPVERRSRFVPGDVIAIPTTNTNPVPMPHEWTDTSGVIDVRVSHWIATMNSSIGAGFYADVYGPLPFAVGSVPDERFTMLAVIPIRAGAQQDH
ncbi:MAG TPA: glycosyltransferase family 39 protein [Gemmatimonadaceae bacterium]|nr:glycosyltransferase family 39 protein [Gemmatimonadaceae bacterium]